MRNKIKRILAAVMAAGMTLSVIPSITTYAAQSNEYVDPADHNFFVGFKPLINPII